MSTILTETITQTKIDADGTKIESTKKRDVEIISGESAYVKLYKKQWVTKEGEPDRDRNKIPPRHRLLFLELAMEMTACDCTDFEHSQLVNTYGRHGKKFMDAMGWKNDSSLKQGLKALCDCGAIRRVERGTYQVNPRYAAKGKWLNAGQDKSTEFSGIKKLTELYDKYMNDRYKEKGQPFPDDYDDDEFE